MRRLTVPLELKASPSGQVEGYGSVFNTEDSYGDVVMPGAFTRTLQAATKAGRLPAMLWQHEPSDPVGVWTEIREDAYGLRVTGQLTLGATRGRDAFELIQCGAVTGLSIGFRTVRARVDDLTKVRFLQDVELHEVSWVTFPACADARVHSAKQRSSGQSDAEIAALLRRAAASFSTAA